MKFSLLCNKCGLYAQRNKKNRPLISDKVANLSHHRRFNTISINFMQDDNLTLDSRNEDSPSKLSIESTGSLNTNHRMINKTHVGSQTEYHSNMKDISNLSNISDISGISNMPGMSGMPNGIKGSFLSYRPQLNHNLYAIQLNQNAQQNDNSLQLRNMPDHIYQAPIGVITNAVQCFQNSSLLNNMRTPNLKEFNSRFYASTSSNTNSNINNQAHQSSINNFSCDPSSNNSIHSNNSNNSSYHSSNSLHSCNSNPNHSSLHLLQDGFSNQEYYVNSSFENNDLSYNSNSPSIQNLKPEQIEKKLPNPFKLEYGSLHHERIPIAPSHLQVNTNNPNLNPSINSSQEKLNCDIPSTTTSSLYHQQRPMSLSNLCEMETHVSEEKYLKY